MRAKPRPWAGDEFKARAEKLSRWLLYGVVIGLLPFAFPFVKGAVVGPHTALICLCLCSPVVRRDEGGA